MVEEEVVVVERAVEVGVLGVWVVVLVVGVAWA